MRAILPLRRGVRDYEIVIFAFGAGGLGCSKFSPWLVQALQAVPKPTRPPNPCCIKRNLTMNTRTLLALATVAFAAASGSAFAQEAGSDAWMNAASTKTRAEVSAELAAARADGSIKAVSAGYVNPIVAQKTRAQVRQDVLAAARSGELERLHAEAYAFNGAHSVAAATRVAQAQR